MLTDERNINPFTGSFLDYRWVIKLYPITLTGSTYVRVQGTFQTEPEMHSPTLAIWEDVYRGMIHEFSFLCQPVSPGHFPTPGRKHGHLTDVHHSQLPGKLVAFV